MEENSSLAVTQEDIPVTYFAATNAEEMTRAQGGLIAWADGRVRQAEMEVLEIDRAAQHAKKNKWEHKTLDRQLTRAKSVLLYYQKVGAALREGYVLVPAFPINVFAIRTTKRGPARNENYTTKFSDSNRNKEVASSLSPAGSGEYVSSEADRGMQYMETVKEGGMDKKMFQFFNTEFKDVSFPLVACKPEVMGATARAMASKIFDEIGIVVDGRQFLGRKGDPLIIGTVCQPVRGYQRKKCHFLISWHVNVADI